MVLWEHPFERYLALGSLVVIALSLAVLAGKRLLEPPALVLETPPVKKVPPPTLKVHVKGAVQRPGVYSLPFGSRVEDAVKKAQPRSDAKLDDLNLAAFLDDGQEIFVPSKRTVTTAPSALALSPSLPQPRPSPSAKAKEPIPIVHLNTATETDFLRLPGIGPVLAKRIVEYRRRIGGFKSIEQLLDVKGIGPKKLERIRPYVRL